MACERSTSFSVRVESMARDPTRADRAHIVAPPRGKTAGDAQGDDGSSDRDPAHKVSSGLEIIDAAWMTQRIRVIHATGVFTRLCRAEQLACQLCVECVPRSTRYGRCLQQPAWYLRVLTRLHLRTDELRHVKTSRAQRSGPISLTSSIESAAASPWHA